MIRTEPLGQCESALAVLCSKRLSSSAEPTTGAVASGMAKASFHRVKWSTRTHIHLFLLVVSGIGSTKSTATFCQGRHACSLCFSWGPFVPPCFAAWQILQHFTTFRIIVVMPGQYQVNWSQLMFLVTPDLASACVFYTTLLWSEGGHMAHHRGLL